ncbi:hypothetical protein PC116_g14733 [Phytophthora cactorum]|nr:hypothetical protein PC116_g14733 [Phytophthora cactorum]
MGSGWTQSMDTAWTYGAELRTEKSYSRRQLAS